MKKKFLIPALAATLLFSLTSCAGKENDSSSGENESNQEVSVQAQDEKENKEESEVKQEEPKEESKQEQETANTHTIDGITITAEAFTIEPFDTYEEYTKRIAVNFTIQNDTDLAFGYITSWEGRLNDGYKLNGWADIMSLDLKQVPSGEEKTDTAYFLIDDSVDPEEIIVSYYFMDYGEEYWEDFGKIMNGEMGQSEYMEKYGNHEFLEFNVTKE